MKDVSAARLQPQERCSCCQGISALKPRVYTALCSFCVLDRYYGEGQADALAIDLASASHVASVVVRTSIGFPPIECVICGFTDIAPPPPSRCPDCQAGHDDAHGSWFRWLPASSQREDAVWEVYVTFVRKLGDGPALHGHSLDEIMTSDVLDHPDFLVPTYSDGCNRPTGHTGRHGRIEEGPWAYCGAVIDALPTSSQGGSA